jgi:flavin-dependent dehydrogenase
MTDFDAVVVGASVAGCTAARLYAQRGARVALVERRPDIDAYKTVCTHYIQPSATPTIERLGLAALIEEHGAVRNSIDLWTPYGGWIHHRGDTPYGYNVTREVLDPLLRRMTAETPGVELLAGHTATELLTNGQSGVVVEDRQRARTALRARLIVAADGRDTHMAPMAGEPGRVRPHNRFFYWAYWRGVEPAGDRSRMWFMEPDCAYSFPNEDGLCILLAAPHRTATACPSSETTSRARI